MRTDNLFYSSKWNYESEAFGMAMDFLKTTDFSACTPGEVIEAGRGVRAEIQEYTTKPTDQCRFESHRKYFDIQYVCSGEEMMGYTPQRELEPDGGYDEDSDLEFYKEPASPGYIHLRAGDYAIVSPDDGHKPRCIGEAPCVVRKIVVKVPAERL